MALRGSLSFVKLLRTSRKYQQSLPIKATSFPAAAAQQQQLRFVSQDMENAKKRVSQLTEDPGNETKLKMYALYKQATVGKCNTSKPGVFDFVGQAKWNAWNNLGEITKEEAEKEYIGLVDSLVGSSASPASASESEKESVVAEKKDVKGLDIVKENGVCAITINRPKKLNAITHEMYAAIRDTLNETAKDDTIRVLVLTGAGNYYSSGNDLSNFTKIPPEGPKKLAADAHVLLKSFVNAFINYPKPLVCAVNGPALGIMVTTLALADLVYCTDNATFHTPFMTLGQSPEGCSSYTFPKIMGDARANDVLLAGRKLTAQEAFDRGLVTDIIPQGEFRSFIDTKAKYVASLPPKSVVYSKALNRLREKEMLERVNEEECVRLEERWLSEECMNAVMSFLAKQSKM